MATRQGSKAGANGWIWRQQPLLFKNLNAKVSSAFSNQQLGQ
jgi:hypothetical protein